MYNIYITYLHNVHRNYNMYTIFTISTCQCAQQEVCQLRGAAGALQGGRRQQAQPAGEDGEGHVGLQVGTCHMWRHGASVMSDHAGRCSTRTRTPRSSWGPRSGSSSSTGEEPLPLRIAAGPSVQIWLFVGFMKPCCNFYLQTGTCNSSKRLEVWPLPISIMKICRNFYLLVWDPDMS